MKETNILKEMTTTLRNNAQETISAKKNERPSDVSNAPEGQSVDKANLNIAIDLLNNADFQEGN